MKMKKLAGRKSSSCIYLGESISNLDHYLPAGKNIIITDRNVSKLYSSSFPDAEIIEIEPGENSKTLRTIEHIYERFLDAEIDRNSSVIGIGGGIVCDIAGFAASTYMRGFGFAFVPTTLLAQVDASIGGKNGVNFRGYKNIIGTINQPDLVLVDHRFLETLPLKEVKNGLAEVIKIAAIGDKDLFRYLEDNKDKVMELETNAIRRIISETVEIKLRIVSKDEYESGERRKLNFGHTFGHAIEKNSSYNHGEAVSIGMVIAVDMSGARGMLTEDDAERVKKLIKDYGLPHSLDVDMGPMIEAVRKDKKRAGADIKFVFLNGIGNAKIVDIPLSDFQKEIIYDK